MAGISTAVIRTALVRLATKTLYCPSLHLHFDRLWSLPSRRQGLHLDSHTPLRMRKTTTSSTWLISAAFIIGFHIHQAHAATYNVVPDPSSSSSGSGLYGLSGALEVATAGDTIFLADGTYTDQILSVVSGEDGSPITIIGGRDAVIQGESPSIEINHSWITLEVR